MKKTTLCLAAIVAGATYVSAQEVSVSTTFSWESEYIFRGAQFAEEYFAPSVDISYGGFYTGIWAALPVEDEANEVDYYAGYSFPAGETMSADVGFTYYTFPSVEDDFFDSDTNTFEIYGGLAFDVAFAPAVYVFYDFDLETLTVEGAGGHSWEVGDSATVDVSASLGYVTPDIGDDYTYWSASLGYSYAFTDYASASIGVNYYGASEELMYEMDDNTITYGFSFTAGF
jgi:uncharacterized protein (TIGR02001 family)